MPHVLLVDDDRECLTALSNRLRFAFRNHALKVDSADCATTGLILAHEGRYDALVVDVCMPGINGIKFVEQLRRTQPNVPIVMMTGWDITACEEHAAWLGVIACLSKPIEFAQLLGLLANLLAMEHQESGVHRAALSRPQATSVRAVTRKKGLRRRRSQVHYGALNLDDQRFHTS